MHLTDDPDDFADRRPALPPVGPVTMRAALLVDPGAFAVAEESAEDNRYMDPDQAVDRALAMSQHGVLGEGLRRSGVPTIVLPACSGLPDAVFPNNVYAITPDVAVLGSMLHPIRRAEAEREDARVLLEHTLGRTLVDLSDGPVGELTGVLAIDHPRRAAICGLSGRCVPEAVEPMARALGLELVLVTPLVPEEYHLNVVLAVLAGRAVVMHDAAFVDGRMPRAMDRAFDGAVHHLSREEKDAFAANCMAFTPDIVGLSQTAEDALETHTRRFFDQQGFTRLAVDVSELEKGGGSLRCLVAEVF